MLPTCGRDGDLLGWKGVGVIWVQQSCITEVVGSIQGRVKRCEVQDGHRALIQADILCLHWVHQVGALTQRQSILHRPG